MIQQRRRPEPVAGALGTGTIERWVPAAIDGPEQPALAIAADAIRNASLDLLRYVVIDDLEGGTATLVGYRWPRVHPDSGALIFGADRPGDPGAIDDEGTPISLEGWLVEPSGSHASLQTMVNGLRSALAGEWARRPLRVGDTFALISATPPLPREAGESPATGRTEPTEHVSSAGLRLFDITAAARDVAKAALMGQVAPAMPPDDDSPVTPTAVAPEPPDGDDLIEPHEYDAMPAV